VLIEPSCICLIDDYGNLEIDLIDEDTSNNFKDYKFIEQVPLDPIELSIFGNRFMSIAEQMGITL